MTENITACPDCSSSFETTDEVASLPIQAIQQECPDCGYTVRIAIINFPDGTYEVVAPALMGDNCTNEVASDDDFGVETCTRSAMMKIQRVGFGSGARCADCMRSDHEEALDLRSEL